MDCGGLLLVLCSHRRGTRITPRLVTRFEEGWRFIKRNPTECFGLCACWDLVYLIDCLIGTEWSQAQNPQQDGEPGALGEPGTIEAG